MTGKLLLLALMLGVVADVGANEARAGAGLGTPRLVAGTARDPLFAPAGFKRQGSHRSFGGHQIFRGPKFLAGRHFGHGGSMRLFSGKRLRQGVIVRKHFGSPRRFDRFGHGTVIIRPHFGSPQLFHGKRFGHGDVLVRKQFRHARLFFGQRFGHREFFSAKHRHRFHR